MAILKRKVRPSVEIPTASMADIAFLLLIFFLSSTVFDEEKGLPVVLPGESSEVEVPPEDVLSIVIRADGLVELRRGGSPAIQTVAADRIGDIWRLEASRNPDLIAAVRTHPDAEYRYMVDVLDQLQRVGAARISLDVLERSRP